MSLLKYLVTSTADQLKARGPGRLGLLRQISLVRALADTMSNVQSRAEQQRNAKVSQQNTARLVHVLHLLVFYSETFDILKVSTTTES